MGLAPSKLSPGTTSSLRSLVPELLDHLPESDPRAQRSRRDLQRVNAWMRNADHMLQLIGSMGLRPPKLMAEIGAGDGRFMLQVARKLAPRWAGVELQMVDRLSLVTSQTIAEFQELGWTATVVQADAIEWLSRPSSVDLLVANLFLHHFTNADLQALLGLVSRKSPAFAACEPKRFPYPTLAGSLVWFLGCNAVTRHDAVASVMAGFRGHEISDLWQDQGAWRLEEFEAGWFSHGFAARRTESVRVGCRVIGDP